MAGKSKITIATLVNLGAPKLAALLLAGAAGNKQLKQAIELAISGKKGPEILAANVRKRLASFAKSRSAKSHLFDTSSWGPFCDVSLTLKQARRSERGAWIKIDDYPCRIQWPRYR